MNGDKKNTTYTAGNRRCRAGIYSMVLSLVVLAIAVVVNVGVERLPGTITKLDTSFNDMFTITDQTADILSNLNEDVTVYFVATSGKEDSAISEMLSRYEALSPHISVVHRDPTLYPNFVSEYTDEVLYNSSLIVVSDKRSKVIDYHDIYSTQYEYSYLYNDYYAQTYFAGEDELTSAIDFVTTDVLPLVYVLTGHGERSLSDDFTAAVEKANLRLAELSLISEGAVPNDAACLLINSPASDLGSDEARAVLEYMQQGGRVMLVSSYNIGSMPNFALLLESYGLESVDGYIIEENSKNYMNMASYLLPTIENHDITLPLTDGDYHVLMPGAHGISPIDTHRSTLKIVPLLSTSEDAFSKLNVSSSSISREEGDAEGPFLVGAAVSERLLTETTKLVWYSSGYMLDDNINAFVGGGNSMLFVNSLTWMCDVEDAYTIPAHSLGVNALQTPTAWIYVLTALFIIGMPGAVIATGAVILHRRKNR